MLFKSAYLGDKEIVKAYKGNTLFYEAGLPSGYTSLNYLQSSGTQWINTGIILSTAPDMLDITMDVDVDITDSDKGLCGNNNGGGNNRFVVGCYQRKIYAFCGDGNNTYSAQYSAGFRRMNIEAIFGNGTKDLIIDGTIYSTTFTSPIHNNSAIRVFRSLTTDYDTSNINAKIYSFKLTVNGTSVCDYIPALDTNNRPCMFDMVSRQPFYNEGTGEFLYG